jgi:hypothetical protein
MNEYRHRMKKSPTLIRKARSFVRSSWFEKLWLLPVWLLLGVSRFLILTMHFRRIVPWLGMQAGINPWIPLIDPVSEARARSIAQVVQMASGYTPWVSNCFPQAVTARILLGFYGIPYGFFFGVSRDPDDVSMKAHAWVAAGRVRVTGGASFGEFTVVRCFVAPDVNSAMLS